MKKIKIVALALIMLVLVAAFASCSGNLALDDLYAKEYQNFDPAYTAGKELTAEGDLIDVAGDLALFSKYVDNNVTTYTVYHLKNEAVVATFSTSATVDYDITVGEVLDSSYYVVYSEDKTNQDAPVYSAKLYSAAAVEVASSSKKDPALYATLDLVRFDGAIYRAGQDGTFAKLCDYSTLAGELPEFALYDGKYYYAVDTDGKVIYSYDEAMQPLAVYAVPSYATSHTIGLLGEGKLLVQYRISLPDDTEKYDLYQNETKFDLVTVLIDMKNGNAKDIDFEYVLVTAFSQSVITEELGRNLFEEVGVQVDILAIAQEIVDKRVSTDYDSMKYLSLSSDGKVKGEIITIDNQVGLPERLTAERFVVVDKAGQKFLLNYDGDVIGNITGAEYYGEKMIVTQDAVYSLDLTEIYNLTSNHMTVYHFFEKGALLLQDDSGDIYLYTANGDPTKIVDNEKSFWVDVDEENGYFVVRNNGDTETSYVYYAEDGKQLLSVTGKLNATNFYSDNYLLFKLNGKYYVFK